MENYDSLNCHPSEILDFDVHKSGRLLVTCAMDKKIKLWNLMEMKECYHKNFEKVLDFVRFLDDDNLLVGFGGKELVIFGVEGNGVEAVLDHGARLTSLIVQGGLILVGGKFFPSKFSFFYRHFQSSPQFFFLQT